MAVNGVSTTDLLTSPTLDALIGNHAGTTKQILVSSLAQQMRSDPAFEQLPASPRFTSLQALIDDTTLTSSPGHLGSVSTGDRVFVEKEAVVFVVADSSVTDHDVQNAAATPVKFYQASGLFDTRDRFRSAVARGETWSVGQIVDAGGYLYEATSASTMIPDLPGFKPYGWFVTPQHFGAKADAPNPYEFYGKSAYMAARAAVNGGAGATDDQAAITSAASAADTLNLVLLFDGHYFTADVARYPDGLLDAAFARDDGPRIRSRGDNPAWTSIATAGRGCLAPASAAYLPDGSFDVSWVPNFQTHNTLVQGITFIGPMDTQQPSNGFLAANSRMAKVVDCPGFGFTDGAPIVLFSVADGGAFKPTVKNSYIGHDIYILGTQTRTIDAMLYMSNRWGVRLLTRARSGGKPNDFHMSDVLGYLTLEGFVSTKPVDFGGTSLNYGPGNISVSDCMAFAEPARKYREGTLAAGATSTEWVFSYAAGYDADVAGDDFSPASGVKFLLRVVVNGARRYREITAYNPATKTITISSALPPEFSGGDARIMFSTEKIIAENVNGTFPRFMDLHSNENISLVNINAEEFEVPIVVAPEVKRATLVAPRLKVSDGVNFLMVDGSPCSAPISVIGGFDALDIGGMIANNQTLGFTNRIDDQGIGQGGDGGDQYGYVFSSTSALDQYPWDVSADPNGAYVEAGMCVQMESSANDGRANARPKVRIATGNNIDNSMLVGGPAGKRYYNGDYIPVLAAGARAFALVEDGGAVAVSGRLSSAANGLWRAAAPTDPDMDSILVAEGVSAGGGTGSTRVKINVRVK